MASFQRMLFRPQLFRPQLFALRRTVPRAMMSSKRDSFGRNRRASEKEWITKQERKQLQALVNKLTVMANPETSEHSRLHLAEIFKDHKLDLSSDLETALRKWKADGNHDPVHKDE